MWLQEAFAFMILDSSRIRGSTPQSAAQDVQRLDATAASAKAPPISCLSIPISKIEASHGEKSLALEFASLVTFALAAKRRIIHASVRSHVRLIPNAPLPRGGSTTARGIGAIIPPPNQSPPLFQFGRYSAQPITSPTLIWVRDPLKSAI